MDAKDSSFEIAAGIRLNKYVSLSMGYRDMGGIEAVSKSDGTGPVYTEGPVEINSSVDGQTISLAGHLPLNEYWGLSATAGIYRWDEEAELKDREGTILEVDTSGYDPFYGVGVTRKIAGALHAGIEFFRYGDESDVDIVQASLVYYFPTSQSIQRSAPSSPSRLPAREKLPNKAKKVEKTVEEESRSTTRRKPKGNMTRAAEEYDRRFKQSQ